MTWTPVKRDEIERGLAFVERIREARKAPGVAPGWLPPDGLVEADADAAFEGMILTWIRTAVAAGYGYAGDAWLPCSPDFSKSALFERLRSGKAPLAEPPPLGLSCPWYALIEDTGPHYVMEATRDPNDPDRMFALGNPYYVVARAGPQDVTVRDAGHETSYRFRLWRDPDYVHPRVRMGNDGWFLQELTYAAAAGAEAAFDAT